ncbi:MAG: hypothetical protein IPM91_01305 [Bacteroidetes bacterium]|nr:hypothetical protein [Bacteroidota bacterium]
MKNKWWNLLTILVLAIIGLSALPAGYSFMTDPSGAGIGLTIEYLHYSPFNDYWIPGLVLFSANGVMNILALLAMLFKFKYYPQFVIYKDFF